MVWGDFWGVWTGLAGCLGTSRRDPRGSWRPLGVPGHSRGTAWMGPEGPQGLPGRSLGIPGPPRDSLGRSWGFLGDPWVSLGLPREPQAFPATPRDHPGILRRYGGSKKHKNNIVYCMSCTKRSLGGPWGRPGGPRSVLWRPWASLDPPWALSGGSLGALRRFLRGSWEPEWCLGPVQMLKVPVKILHVGNGPATGLSQGSDTDN